MRVPNSPHSLKKVMSSGKSSSEGEDSDGLGVGVTRPPRPKRTKQASSSATRASRAKSEEKMMMTEEQMENSGGCGLR